MSDDGVIDLEEARRQKADADLIADLAKAAVEAAANATNGGDGHDDDGHSGHTPTTLLRAHEEIEWDGRLAALLSTTADELRRYVVMGNAEVVATVLWLAGTYVYEHSRAVAYLHFASPDPGSGKTTALEFCEMVANNALVVDGLSPAVLFRMMDELRPTLLYDEVDSVFGTKGNDATEAIRSVLNSGYSKDKKVWRCDGPQNTLRAFDVYGPKAMAGLGQLPRTLAHRAIPISMQPPRADEHYEEFDPEDFEPTARNLRSRYMAWAKTAGDALRDPARRPEKVTEMDARRNQIWRLLFRIADLAGGTWPESARLAAIQLSSGQIADDEKSLGVRLLSDLRDIFSADTRTRLYSETLIQKLLEIDDSPWGDFYGKPFTKNKLASMLRGYGIRSHQVREDASAPNKKGYRLEDFADAWARYLPEVSPQDDATDASQRSSRNEAISDRYIDPSCSGSESAAIPHGDRDASPASVYEPDPQAITVDLTANTCVVCDGPLPEGWSGMRCQTCAGVRV